MGKYSTKIEVKCRPLSAFSFTSANIAIGWNLLEHALVIVFFISSLVHYRKISITFFASLSLEAEAFYIKEPCLPNYAQRQFHPRKYSLLLQAKTKKE